MLQTNVAGHPILQRKLSIYITRLFLETRVTPNQVTVLMLLTGVAGALVLALGYVWLGFFFCYLCVLLDATDGELARYRRKFSLRGVYLDLLNHVAMESLFFFGLTLWVADAFGTPNMPLIIIGMLGTIALTFTRINGDLPQQLYVHYGEHRKNFTLPPRSEHASHAHAHDHGPTGPIRSIKEAIYSLRHFAVMLIVLFVVFVVERVFLSQSSGHPLLSVALVGYVGLFWIFLLREIYGVFSSVEVRVAAIRDALDKTHE